MKRINSVITVTLLAVSLTACGNSSGGNDAAVQSVSALCGYSSVGASNRFMGQVITESTVQVKKSDDLTIAEVMVSVGDEVTEGQVLFCYDGDEAQLNLDKAQLELEQLVYSIESKTDQIAQLEKSQASASTSDQKLEYSLEIQELQADIEQDTFNRMAKEKEVTKLQNVVDNLEVLSPADGTIKSIADDSTTDSGSGDSTKAYIVITKTGNFRVEGYLNENNVGSISEGMRVRLVSRINENDVWTGTISNIDLENPIGSGNSDSASSDGMSSSSKYPFYIDLDDQEGLLLGQHVIIEPAGDEEASDDIVLSAGYVNDPDGNAWVWAESSSGKLEKRSVTLGEYREAEDSYVIAGGLSLEDYVAYPETTLKEGMTCIEYETSYGEEMEDDSMDMEEYDLQTEEMTE